MAMDFTPQRGDSTIHIPVTFDYQPGRSSNTKSKVWISIISVLIVIVTGVVCFSSETLVLWQKIVYFLLVGYIALLVIRFVVFKETHYSNMYETLVQSDYRLDTKDFWQIFDIGHDYPYICYFKNGKQGIFVRMEKDALTGKASDAVYDHYEAISEAYNQAHALNMDIVHVDYMDNIGNDARLAKMYDDLDEVSNPDMQDMLIDMYDHLEREMANCYTSYDIYLFLTRDKVENLIYNVQTVANLMLGGNFITYRVLSKAEISGVCTALFNFHDFSINEACEKLVRGSTISGIVPIRVQRADGTIEEINKTQEEKEELRKEAERKAQERKKAQENAKLRQKAKKAGTKSPDDEEIDLF